MKKIGIAVLLVSTLNAFSQNDPARLTEVWNPQPRIVIPGTNSTDAPSDAIVLFDGKNLNEWAFENGKAASWNLENGILTVTKGMGEIQTKKSFGDCQLHIEWRSPALVKGEGQGRGNSGIFLMGKYELQVLDNYENKTYSNGQAGSIYKQAAPLVNASRKPGQWQQYDINFTAPTFNKDSALKSPGRITVLHNGVLVQNNTTIWGATQYIGIANNKWHNEKLPIKLQDHGDAVSYRNIWIREL